MTRANRWIQLETLDGLFVRLERMTPGHAPGLLAGATPEVFRHMPKTPHPWDESGFAEYIEERTAAGWAFVVVERESGTVIGSTSMFDLHPEHLNLEIGHTWYSESVRGTAVNPECKMLLLQHAFEVLGCVRVQFKCDERNQRSRRAIEKLGAKFEGVRRSVMILPDGHRRNTAYFSILEEEWPIVKESLMNRLTLLGYSL